VAKAKTATRATARPAAPSSKATAKAAPKVKPTSKTVAVKPAAKTKVSRPEISAPGKGAKATVVAKLPGKGATKGAASASKPAPVSKPAPMAKPTAVNKPAPTAKPSNGKPARPPLVPGGTLIPPPSAKPKPGKNLAGLSARELETFREALLAKRRELVGDMYSMEREALQRSGENLSNLPLHMADMGTDNYEQEFTLGLMEKDRQLLREINVALAKINDGTYGICEGTGKPIAKVRLEVQPWAKYSIEHARKLENRGVR
jgi:RNA polymerase-binding protein DksA